MLRKCLIAAIASGALATMAHAGERRFDFADINAIEAGGAFNIVVAFGDTQSVVVEEPDNRFEYLDIEVDDGVLELGFVHRGDHQRGPDYTVTLTIKSLREVDISGASKILIDGFKGDNLELDTSGASQIVINGQCKTLQVDTSGAVKLVAKDLKCDSVHIDVSGAASASVHANKALEADVSGVSKLIVYGKPDAQTLDASGLSKVEIADS